MSKTNPENGAKVADLNGLISSLYNVYNAVDIGAMNNKDAVTLTNVASTIIRGLNLELNLNKYSDSKK